jgi:hypothetical protein
MKQEESGFAGIRGRMMDIGIFVACFGTVKLLFFDDRDEDIVLGEARRQLTCG